MTILVAVGWSEGWLVALIAWVPVGVGLKGFFELQRIRAIEADLEKQKQHVRTRLQALAQELGFHVIEGNAQGTWRGCTMKFGGSASVGYWAKADTPVVDHRLSLTRGLHASLLDDVPDLAARVDFGDRRPDCIWLIYAPPPDVEHWQTRISEPLRQLLARPGAGDRISIADGCLSLHCPAAEDPLPMIDQLVDLVGTPELWTGLEGR